MSLHVGESCIYHGSIYCYGELFGSMVCWSMIERKRKELGLKINNLSYQYRWSEGTFFAI